LPHQSSSSSEEDDVLELKRSISGVFGVFCMLDFRGMGLKFHALTMRVPIEGPALGGKPHAEVQRGKSLELLPEGGKRQLRPSMKNALQSG
jgi:hypothetical protein